MEEGPVGAVIAFERPAGYTTQPAVVPAGEPGAVLAAAADGLVAGRVDELSDEQLVAEIACVDRVRKQLDARLARLTRTLARRRGDRAERQAPQGRGLRERRRAEQDARRELADQLNWQPDEAKRHENEGRRLEFLPQASDAIDRGEISARHVRVLDGVLRHLVGEVRDRVEEELLEVAKNQDPVEFGRTCRRRLAELDPDASTREHRNRQARTRASMSQTDDGMLKVFGQWTGLDAETIATAVHAFRRPDRPDELRRAEQRTAEAFVEVARAALRAAEAPEEHGVRPHVILTVPIGLLEERGGVAEGAWSGPIDRDALREVLDDVGLAWMVTDRDGLPLEASAETRTVPVGLWRALHLRDGGCIHQGCDAPASWCDVMHLDVPYAHGGRLSLDNAGLGCRRHHRAYDAGHLHLHWNNRRPQLRPREPQPAASRERLNARDGPDP